MSRPARPEDLYDLRIATDPRLSPDGRLVAFTVQVAAARRDGYRHSIWLVTADGSAPARQLTIGAKHDRHARFSPDGRSLAFISDRRLDDRGDARRAGRPRGRRPGPRAVARRRRSAPPHRPAARRRRLRLVARRAAARGPLARRAARPARKMPAAGARRRKPDPAAPPPSDYRFADRLGYQNNGAGFIVGKEAELWVVDAADGTARRLRRRHGTPVTTRPGRRTVGGSPSRPTGAPTATRCGTSRSTSSTSTTAPRRGSPTSGTATSPARPGCRTGGRSPSSAIAIRPGRARATTSGCSRPTAPRPDRAGGRNLSGRHDLMPGSGMGSDITPGEEPRLAVTAGGRWITFSAPYGGSYELWRISTADGDVVRLTEGHHYLSAFDQVTPPKAGGRATRSAARAAAASPTRSRRRPPDRPVGPRRPGRRLGQGPRRPGG